MNVFRMNGVQIHNEMQFRRFFSPTDFLRQRELAAGFAVQVLKPLSFAENFHSCQLYRAVFQELPPETADWTAYAKQDTRGIILSGGDEALLEDLWALLIGQEIPTEEQARLSWVLAAGYLLAGRTLDDTPLSREAAETAYRREPEGGADAAVFHIPASGDIPLPAGPTNRLVLDPERALPLLQSGRTIMPRKLVAAVHWQGDPDIPARLEVLRGPEDPEPLLLTLPVGEYLYCNFVDEIPVCLHRTTVTCGVAVMTRTGNLLTISHPDRREPVRIDCTGRNIISFVPEPDGRHWLLLDTEGLDYSRYSLRDVHGERLWWMRHIVELSLREDQELLLLDNHGKLSSVFHSRAPLRSRCFTRLDDVPPEQKGAEQNDDV